MLSYNTSRAHCSSALRIFWREVVDLVGTFPKIGGGGLEDLALQLEMAREGKSRIIRHVQPLVPINGDRVGCFQTVQYNRTSFTCPYYTGAAAITVQPIGFFLLNVTRRRIL